MIQDLEARDSAAQNSLSPTVTFDMSLPIFVSGFCVCYWGREFGVCVWI